MTGSWSWQLTVAIVSGAAAASAPLVRAADPWARLVDDGTRLVISEGTVAEFCGRGRLQFTEGRRAVVLSELVECIGSRRGEDPIILAGGDVGFWTIRPVPAMPERPGTTIRDERADRPASISSSALRRFWLAVEPASVTFLHPNPPDDRPPCIAPVAERIDEALSRYAEYGFSGVVLVAEGDRIVHVGGYGLADRESAVPMQPGTVIPLASLTKHVTAAAILKLQEAGRLSTDDRLARFWPELPEPVASITIHELLCHSSGLPEDIDAGPTTRAEVLAALHRAHVSEQRRARATYSNFGYVVLAGVVEEVYGMPFGVAVEQLLLAPAGLASSIMFDLEHVPPPLLATGYVGTFGSGRALDPKPVTLPGPELVGASGAVSSLPGLFRWLRALRSGKVLGAAARRRMFAAHTSNVGYGWFLYETPHGSTMYLHGGDTDGFQTYAGIYPDEDMIVLLAVNDARGWRGPVYDTVVKLARGSSGPPLPPPVAELEPELLAAHAGVYALPGDEGRLEVETLPGGLLVSAIGQRAVSLLSSPDSTADARHAQQNAASASFVSALATGRTEAVDEALAPSGRSESFYRVWGYLQERHGRLDGFRVLGTLPDRAGRDVTFVRLHFEDGDDTLRLVWRPHLDGWGTGGDQPRREFRPIGASTFATFDIFSDAVVRLRFDRAGVDRLLDFPDAPDTPAATLVEER